MSSSTYFGEPTAVKGFHLDSGHQNTILLISLELHRVQVLGHTKSSTQSSVLRTRLRFHSFVGPPKKCDPLKTSQNHRAHVGRGRAGHVFHATNRTPRNPGRCAAPHRAAPRANASPDPFVAPPVFARLAPPGFGPASAPPCPSHVPPHLGPFPPDRSTTGSKPEATHTEGGPGDRGTKSPETGENGAKAAPRNPRRVFRCVRCSFFVARLGSGRWTLQKTGCGRKDAPKASD